MKCLVAMLTAVFVAGCMGAPDSFDLPPMEESGRPFIPPSPAEPKVAVQEILMKDELTLQDILAVADLTNPELASERKNVDLATAAVWEARLYPNPSATLEVEDHRTGEGTTLGKMERTLGISVPLVVGGRIAAATSAAGKEREIAAIRYVWRRREILSDVKNAFISSLASRRNVELARETRDIAKALHDVTNERFKAQAIPEMELLKAAVNLAVAETDLNLAEKNLGLALKTLHARMGNIDFSMDRFTGNLFDRFTTPNLEALRRQVSAAHPLLQVAEKVRESADAQFSLARAERIPDLGLEVTVGRDPEDDMILKGGLEIPLPLFNRNHAKILAAEIRVRQAELGIETARNDIALRLTEAHKNLIVAQDRVTAYRDEILPKARKSLDQTNDGHKLGKFGYLDVLDAQRTLAEAKVAFAAALTELNLAASELEKITGIPLDVVG